MVIDPVPTKAGGQMKKLYKKTAPGPPPQDSRITDDPSQGAADLELPSDADQPPAPVRGGATIGTLREQRVQQAKESDPAGGNSALAEASAFDQAVKKRSAKVHKNRGRM